MKEATRLELIRALSRILFEDWDPIGVNRRRDVDDEYVSQARGVVKRAMRMPNATGRDVAMWLKAMRVEGIGGSDQDEIDARVGERIARLLRESGL